MLLGILSWALAYAAHAQNILILGDSLTAGYGIDPTDAYPALLEDKLEAAGMPYSIIAAGLSGETTAGGARRIDWALRQPVDMLIIALGGNDGLRGITLQDTERNLQTIIDKAKSKYPAIRIILAGMQIPPNLGAEYTQAFRELYPKISSENDALLIPFLLKDVGGDPLLNLPDGIHPNKEGHAIIAETVWAALLPLLED